MKSFVRPSQVVLAVLLAVSVVFDVRAQSGLNVTTLTASSAYPLLPGATVTWTATVSDAPGPVEYRFYMFQQTTWVLMQDYGASNTLTWTPRAADEGSPYYVQVWVRRTGSSSEYEGYLGSPPFEVLPAPLSLTASVDFPTPAGNSVTWTATSYGAVPREYQFRVLESSTGVWTVFRPYALSAEAQWTPHAAGTYVVDVWMRHVGSTAVYEETATTPALEVASTPVSVSSLNTTTLFPAQTGTPMSWTARAKGGLSGPLQYEFWRYSSQSGWVNAQPYGVSDTFTWIPQWGEAGQYSLQVWVRSNGSNDPYEAWRSTPAPFVIQRVGLELTTPTQFPVGGEMPVVWTARVPDDSVNFEYEFWVYSSQRESWSLGQSYGLQGTFAWNPPSAGTYAIQAWARQAGSTAAYEVYHGTNLFQITSDPPSGPTIITSLSPPPNAAGWNNTPVTVNVHCVDTGLGVATCPASRTITTEGAAQTLSVSAVDTAGHQTTSVVTVNVDFTPPIVELTSPQSGSVVSDPSITLTTNVFDGLSQVQEGRCNGVAGALAAESVSCSVSLSEGANAVVVSVTDRAGNSSSAWASVMRVGTPSKLIVSPVRHTLVPGESRHLDVHDDFGRPITGVAWVSTDENVLRVAEDGWMTGATPGGATVNGIFGNLSATVEVSVVVPEALVTGDSLWSVEPLPEHLIDRNVGLDGPGAALFATTEVRYEGSTPTATHIRAFDASGSATVSVQAPIAAGESIRTMIGDAAGGVLLEVASPSVRSLVRVPLSTDSGSAWRSVELLPRVDPNPGGLVQPSNVAQGSDATIFTFSGETVVGIDGVTGRRRFQIQPVRPAYCIPTSEPTFHVSRFASAIVVDADGYANVLGILRDDGGSATPESPLCDSRSLTFSAATVLLYRISPNGEMTTTPLHNYFEPVYFHVNRTFGNARHHVDPLPDDLGGVLAVWDVCHPVGGPLDEDCSTRARHVGDGVVGPEFELPYDYALGWSAGSPLVSGFGQTGYYGGRDTPLMKIDMPTGNTLWTAQVHGTPVALHADGRIDVAVGQFGEAMRVLDTNDPSIGLDVPLMDVVASGAASRIGRLADGNIHDVVATPLVLDPFGYALRRAGGVQGRYATFGRRGIFVKGHDIQGDPFGYRHASIRIVPRNQIDWMQDQAWGQYFVHTDALSGPAFFLTLGAGSDAPPCSGSLSSDVNRQTDWSLPPSSAVEYERLRYPSHQEDAVIGTLLATFAGYSNDWPYECLPDAEDQSYNSNSYAAGLVRAAGLPWPRFPNAMPPVPVVPPDPEVPGAFQDDARYAGWRKPLPEEAFR